MTCPNCGSKYEQKMPQIAKHINSECMSCHTIFKITNTKDCCVYCKYGNALCPEAQQKINKRK